MSERQTVEQRLEAWRQQPGAVVTDAEWDFIAAMRRHAERGVGYGWMQQVIEWEWQSKGPGALGPEYHHSQRMDLERQRDETMLRLADQDDEMVALIKERDELAEALREASAAMKLKQQVTMWATDDDGQQYRCALHKADALLARIDAGKM